MQRKQLNKIYEMTEAVYILQIPLGRGQYISGPRERGEKFRTSTTNSRWEEERARGLWAEGFLEIHGTA